MHGAIHCTQMGSFGFGQMMSWAEDKNMLQNQLLQTHIMLCLPSEWAACGAALCLFGRDRQAQGGNYFQNHTESSLKGMFPTKGGKFTLSEGS